MGQDEEVSTTDAVMLQVAEMIRLAKCGSLQQETFDLSKQSAVRDAWTTHRPPGKGAAE